MAAKLFVGGLSWNTTDETLSQFFSQVGNVVSATVIKDKFTNRSKGFGFVEMSSDEEAQEAMSKLNGQELDGRAITVNEARPQVPREDRPNRPYNQGGQRGGYRSDRGGDRGGFRKDRGNY
jgi:RNA recognition motif-containing protein